MVLLKILGYYSQVMLHSTCGEDYLATSCLSGHMDTLAALDQEQEPRFLNVVQLE